MVHWTKFGGNREDFTAIEWVTQHEGASLILGFIVLFYIWTVLSLMDKGVRGNSLKECSAWEASTFVLTFIIAFSYSFSLFIFIIYLFYKTVS